MPTVLKVGPYRFYFFVGDRAEPPHIHVKRDRAEAKYWLAPLRLARYIHFPRHELRTIENIIRDNRQLLMEAWNEAFGT
jgi:hypothetical protein